MCALHWARTACALHAHCMRTACPPQALPAALMRSGSSAKAATTLGTLGSVSALVEVMLSNSFGKLTDAIGRKPVLILAPALAVAARATVVVWPSLPVLLGARFCTTLVVPPSRLACAPHVHCVCTACAPHVHRMRTASTGAAVLARLLLVPRRPLRAQLHLPRHSQLPRRSLHGAGLCGGHPARWQAERREPWLGSGLGLGLEGLRLGLTFFYPNPNPNPNQVSPNPNPNQVSLLGLSYVQLAYLASCAFGSAVCFLLAFGLRETLPPERRVPLPCHTPLPRYTSFPSTNPNP